MPKKLPRPKAITVRLSEAAVKNLKVLADQHNMSQADVIEHLIFDAMDQFLKKKSTKDIKK